MSRPIFFVKRGDRLIARLKHVLHAWRFARQCDGQAIMVWPQLPSFWHQFDGPNYSPLLIFDLGEFYRRGGGQNLVFLDGDMTFPPNAPTLRGPDFAAMRNNRFDRAYFKQPGLVFYEPNLMQYHFADEKPTRASINREMAELFAELPLSPPLAKALGEARAKLGEGYVALHVRRGDIYEMLRQDMHRIGEGGLTQADIDKLFGHYVTRTAPLEMYLPHVQAAVAKGQKIAFFSDSPETRDWFVKRLGAGNVVDGGQFKAQFPIQKAMLDFAILCGASQVISTRSNYSGLAADIANCEHVIVSAQKYCAMTPDEAIALYLKDLHSQFAPKVRAGSAAYATMEAEIRRIYLFLNRIAPAAGQGA